MTDMMNLFLGKCNIECWNQCLGEPEGEDEFWTSHEKLRNQSLEETRNTFILHHTSNNLESTLRVFEVAVLDTGLDDIERSGNEEGSRGTGDGSNKVLEPGCFVVVVEAIEIALGEGRSSEKSE